jgi:hypothetical protein
VTLNESSIARYHLLHSVPAYALRLYPVPDPSQVNLHYLCGLWHRLHVAQKLAVLISEHTTKEIFLRDTEAEWIEFLPQLTRMRRRLMPLVFTMFHFFEMYRDLHLQHLEAHGVPLRLQPFTLNPIEKQVMDMYDDDLLLTVHQVFPLVLSSFSRRLRPPLYTSRLERSIKGMLKDKPADEVYATIIIIGGLRQVERFWETKGYNIRRAAVESWYGLVTHNPVQSSPQKSKFFLKLAALGRKKVTLPADPAPAEPAGGVNHKAEVCNDWYCVKPSCVRNHRITNNPIYNTSMAAGPPMKPLPRDQLKLILSDQQPLTSIWLPTAEAVILERKIVENTKEIKRHTHVLLELIKEDGPAIEEWAPSLSQASQRTLQIKDINAFGGIYEQETTASAEPETTVRNEMVEEPQNLHPPSITANADVVEQAQNAQVTTVSAQPPITANRGVVDRSEHLQNTALATETEITAEAKSADHLERLEETNIAKEIGIAARIDIPAGSKHVHDTTPKDGREIVGNMEKPGIQEEISDVDTTWRQIPVKAPTKPQNSNLVSSAGTDNAGEFIVIILICYAYMVTRAITIALLAVQRFVGEPDIPRGMERVRWRCVSLTNSLMHSKLCLLIRI